jgi:hypothetical protein
MQRIALVLLAAATMLALLATQATAGSKQDVSFSMSVLSLNGAASSWTDTNGVLHERSHVYGGIVQDQNVCCEVSLTVDRDVQVSEMRGSMSGTISIGGNSADITWTGELEGRIDADASGGRIVLRDSNGHKLRGSWSSASPDLSMPHGLEIKVEGRLT